MLQLLGGLWRWFQDQSPGRQAIILATPVVAVMLVVLGGLIVWSVAAPLVTPRPTVVVQGNPTPLPPPDDRTAPVTPRPSVVALLPSVVVPDREPTPAPPTETPTPAPTPTPTPVPPVSARVVNTDGQGANMRLEPSVSAQRVKLVHEGTVVELIGGEHQGDGYTWRNIRDVDGSAGYVIAEYLQPIEVPPGATPMLPPPSIQVEEITSPAARGEEATLTIVTRPGERCELRVLLFGPATLPEEGLDPKTADDNGICSWTWTVPEEVVPGTWRYRISAGIGEGRAIREVPFVVT